VTRSVRFFIQRRYHGWLASTRVAQHTIANREGSRPQGAASGAALSLADRSLAGPWASRGRVAPGPAGANSRRGISHPCGVDRYLSSSSR
jgi:hypothetical protein